MAERYWTVEEANASLARVGDRVELARRLLERLRDDDDGRAVASTNGNGHRPRPDERAVADARNGIQAIVLELELEGIVLRDIEQGLIDFTARTDAGREYWLCWLVGEPEVAWWHWPEAGFAGRTPLDQPPA